MKRSEIRRVPINRISTKQKTELALRTKLKKDLMDEQVEERGYNFCQTCDTNGDFRGLSLSHVIALSRGGKTNRDNCIIECYPCHEKYEKKPELRETDNAIKKDNSGVDKTSK